MAMHWNLSKGDLVMKIKFINWILSLSLLAGLNGLAVAGGEGDSPVYTKIVNDAVYEDILDAVKETIKGKGINIAHTLPSSGFLGNTGPAFGITEPVLKNGEMVEFCSAKVSHQLIQANIQNIVICPFNIVVYELNAKPGQVHMTFRKPYVIDEASIEATNAMVGLMIEIIEEAADW
jgi:uncharacterized protein (DUF302 family)